ncbi:MAG: 4'-phosphopantetheinyl transferase superfamily protein [archaeon]
MALNIKTGVDIVQISKFKLSLNNPEFLRNVFTDNELADRKEEHLAGIFAAKEAFFKAASFKLEKWKDIEITSENKKPKINFVDSILKEKIDTIDCSITHDGDYAVSFVVIVFKN